MLMRGARERKHNWIDLFAIWACILTLLLVSFGSLLRPRASLDLARAIPPFDASAPIINGSGFGRDAVYPVTPKPDIDSTATRFGSWIGGDQSTGSIESRWYHVASTVTLLVAGYPNGRDEQLKLIGLDKNNGLQEIPIVPAEAPGEKWRPLTVHLPPSWTRFRIVAADRSSSIAGWLAFSEPVIIRKNYVELLKQYLLLVASSAVSFLLIFAPGFFIRIYQQSRGKTLTLLYLLPFPGLLLTASIGLITWKEPRFIAPALLPSISLALLAGISLVTLRYWRPSSLSTATENKAILVVVVLAAIGITKATYSVGPEGELYLGSISRSLEVGARSDSRISYHVVQMVAAHDNAYGPVITRLLKPWNFSHRGPLAGLAASTVVLSAPVKVPIEFPDFTWQIFDGQGFAAYRVATIVFSCSLLLPVFGLLRLFLPEPNALLSFLVVVGSPFIIHEIYFTWPKIITGGLIVISACLAWERKYFASGLLLGLAFLTHPSALMASPAVAALCVLRLPSVAAFFQELKSLSKALMDQALGAALFLILWRLVNGHHYSQDGFLNYFKMAENLPPTLPNWLAVRWLSIRNTLLPLHLYLFDGHNPAIVLSGIPPAILTFFVQDWTSLPSGFGLLLYPCLLCWLFLAWLHARAWLVLIVFVPLSLFAAYWGSFTTGLLREGLHAWVIGTVCLGCCCWMLYGQTARAWWRYTSLALLLRGVETLCMLILPGIITTGTVVNQQFLANDLAMLSLLGVACAALYLATFRLSEQLRMEAALTT